MLQFENQVSGIIFLKITALHRQLESLQLH